MANTLYAHGYLSKRQQNELLRSQLENERSSFLAHYKDLSDHILPRRPRFSVTDANRGDRRNSKIIDSTATFAARTLRSGMMSGVTSPARPWFRLTTPDPDLAELGSVKYWLDTVSKRMSTVFLKSNLYNALPVLYGDLGVFGTSALMIEEDFEDVIRCFPFPIGSFTIANNDRLKVDVFQREFRMTVRQLVQRFGKRSPSGEMDWSNMSMQVKNLWEQSQFEAWIDVMHTIQPNEGYDSRQAASKDKRYSSCYYEKGSSQTYAGSPGPEDDKFLRESGYDYFPVLCPRWEVTGEDVYGTDCPGMVALGDIRALQVMQKRKAQAVEKMVNPPMVGPSSLRTVKTTILPGDITYTDEREGQKGFRPAHEVNPRIQELLLDVQDHQMRIKKAFYEDLFLMLAQSDRREITAREIDERHEEKLLALGPVLEQLNQDLLDPLIDIAFNIMNRQGLIPPAPEEMQGLTLKVEYISIMAQAQKLVGIAGIERFAGFVGNLVTVTQSAAILDKVDIDQMVDVYGDLTSVPPGIIRPDDEVERIRSGRQQAQQQQAQMEQAAQGATAVKDLAAADTGGDNALTQLMKMAQAGQIAPQQ